MAANQGNWRQLAVGLDAMGSREDCAALPWGDVMDALSDAIVTSSCLPCMMGAADERCNRCRHDCLHSNHCDFEKCIDVLVYFGLRLWTTYKGAGCSRDKKRALAWRINERYRCRIMETRGADLPSVMWSHAFARGTMVRHVRSKLDAGRMSRSVHDVLCSALASGVQTQSELLSASRPHVFAAFDKELDAKAPCAQCDADDHGVANPTGDGTSRKRTSMCQRCRSVWYCSAQCQRAHWDAHKRVCNKPLADVDAILEEARIIG